MSTVLADQIEFTLEEKLGEGLNSTVWRATRYGYGQQTVALKIPKDQTAVSLLEREFKTLQSVNSIHCVRALAFDTFNGAPVLVLEWIDGVTLAEFANQPLTTDERDEIIRQIHCGLVDLHHADLSHGDLHPGNVMIDRSGHIKLIDFAAGLAHNGERQASPAFASPEIWRGDDPSPSSDLFALQIIRDLMSTGYRELPARSEPSKTPLRPAQLNSRAKQSIARRLGPGVIATQVIEVQSTESPRDRIKMGFLRTLPQKPILIRTSAVLLTICLAAFVTTSTEAPSEYVPSTSTVRVRSQNWMRISINGREAGYAPVTVQNLKQGHHRLAWQSAASAGVLDLDLKAGEIIGFRETDGHLTVDPTIRKVH